MDGVMEFLGEGYGDNALQVRANRAVERTLAKLGGDRSLEYMSYWYPCCDDPQDYNSSGGSRWEATTLREVLDGMATYSTQQLYVSDGKSRWVRRQRVNDFSDIESLCDVSDCFRDSIDNDCGGVGPLLTEEQAKAERLEQRRRDLEHHASSFARVCCHAVGTREYILAARRALRRVREERDQWNDPEVRMEQWAACMYAGGGSSVYFDDLNFENARYASRTDGLHQVLEWLEEACPLLMRQVEAEASDCDDGDYDECGCDED